MTQAEIETRLLSSSANPENISMTVKGLVVSLIPILIYLGNKQGLDLDQNTVIAIIDEVFTFVSALFVVFGMGRKIYYEITGLLNTKKGV